MIVAAVFLEAQGQLAVKEVHGPFPTEASGSQKLPAFTWNWWVAVVCGRDQKWHRVALAILATAPVNLQPQPGGMANCFG